MNKRTNYNFNKETILYFDDFLFLKIFLLFILVSGIIHEIPKHQTITIPSDTCSTCFNGEIPSRAIIDKNCAISGCSVLTGFNNFSSQEELTTLFQTSATEYFLFRKVLGVGMPLNFASGPTAHPACDLTKFQSSIKLNFKI